jgi:competence protein CoiA
MPSSAITKAGVQIDAELISSTEWSTLKKGSSVGDYLMPCCRTPAIPKTSVRGVQFFAHLNDECDTAPETQWHIEGKSAVLAALESIGLVGASEVPGGVRGDEWQADTLFELEGRKIAIELQRSCQTVDDYIARQERYARHSVECYWLTRRTNLSAVTKVTGRLRMKREWGGKFPPGRSGFSPLITEFPISALLLGEVGMSETLRQL